MLIHVGYLPAPDSIGELKSKPMQQSISQLNSLGLQPDFVVCRAEKRVDNKRKQKIALASGVSIESIVSNPDLDCIYEVPLELEEQEFSKKITFTGASLGVKAEVMRDTGDTATQIIVDEYKLEEVTGQTDQNPAPYVSGSFYYLMVYHCVILL